MPSLSDYIRQRNAAINGDAVPSTPAPEQERESALMRFLKPLLPSTTPSDYINGPLYAIQHPIDSAKLLGSAIASDPVGAVPVVGNAKRGISKLSEGDLAGAAGEGTAALAALFGLKKFAAPELSLSEAVAPAVEGAVRATGKGIGAAGRFAEGAGAATKHPLVTTATGGAPYIAEAVGRGAQKLGSAVEGLADSSLEGRTPKGSPSFRQSKLDKFYQEPVDRTPFNEKPLYKQMDELPTTDNAVPSGGYPRTGVPRRSNAPEVGDFPETPRKTGGLEDRLNNILPTEDRFRELFSDEEPISHQARMARQSTADTTTPFKDRLAEQAAHAQAETENLAHGSSFGNGHILQELKPSEFSDLATEGPDTGMVYDAEYGIGMPKDIAFEAGNSEIPGLTVGEAGTNPLSSLESRPSFRALIDDPNGFTKFSDSLDSIINAAGPDDLPPARWSSRVPKSQQHKYPNTFQQ